MSNVDKELASAIEILREQHRKLQTHVKYTGGNSTDIDIIHENIISALNNLNSVRAQLSQQIPDGYVLAPIEPTKEILECIGWDKYPQDWEAGKKLQLEKGLDVVPPNYEYEVAVGQYQRLLAAITKD